MFLNELKSIKENTLKELSLFMDQGFPLIKEDLLILLKEFFKVRGMELSLHDALPIYKKNI
nr:hypothetical protein [uncultured Cetobacterium sp.]